MLEDAGNMIYQETTTKENSAAAASSTARQIAEILTSKTTQRSKAKTAKLALPPVRQTTTPTLTPNDLSKSTPGQSPLLKSATRTFLNSLTSKDTTSETLSSPLFSLSATERPKLATAVATKFSSAPTAILKAKDSFTNLTPAYFLTTLAATIFTNVKHNNHNRNSSSNNSNSKNSCWTDSKTIEAEIATNIMIKRRMSQQNGNKNEAYHMLSLNYLNSTNVLQHRQQQQGPQRQYSNKHFQQQQQQQKFKQFLLLLTCFVAIITIFSLPHLSRAAVATATISHMSTTYETPTTTATTNNAEAKTIKSLTITNVGIKTLEELISPTFNSSTGNESKDGDSSYNNSSNNNKNKIADNSDNVDNLTSFSPLATTIDNSLRDFRLSPGSRGKISSRQSFLGNPIIIRFIRSLDVSGNSGGGAIGGGSGMSSIFSPSPGGSAGLTNIFNQNLDTGLSNNIECPSFDESSACPCYKFEDVGLTACLAFVTLAQATFCGKRADGFCRKFSNMNEFTVVNDIVKNDKSRIWEKVNNNQCAQLTKKIGPCASSCRTVTNCISPPGKVCGANDLGTTCIMYANLCALKAAACKTKDLFPAVIRRCTEKDIITVGQRGKCAPK